MSTVAEGPEKNVSGESVNGGTREIVLPRPLLGSLISAFGGFCRIWIAQLGPPIGSTALGRQIKQVPYRPYQIYMAWIQSRLRRSKHQFGVVEVIDLSITPGEYIERRPLFSFFILALIVVIVGVALRRQKAEMVPSALPGNVANALDRRFCDSKKINALIDVRRSSVQSVQD